MGTWISRPQNGPKNPAQYPAEDDGPTAPPVDRESSSIRDKELSAEFTFMLENMRVKQWASEGDNLRQIFQREDNSSFDHVPYMPLSLPLDADGMVQSYAVDDEIGIKGFFDKYGLVIIHDVLTADDCRRSIEEIWSFLERSCQGLDRNNARTWNCWPGLSKLGFLGNTFLLSPQFYQNRQNPNVHHAFSTLLGTPRLHINTGRASVMRPTRNVRLPATSADEERVADMPEWRSRAGEEWLHWDMNPFTGASSSFSWRLRDPNKNRGYEHLRTQAILALSDCAAEDGGFFCVPGSHHTLRGWAQANGPLVNDKQVMSPESCVQFLVPSGDPLREHGQRVPIRAGSLLVWDSRLAHCNFPNDSERMRIVQYIQAIAADDPVFALLHTDRGFLPPESEFKLTPLGERLLGFAPWE